jgi:phosphohistidine phosphatase
MKTLFLLRHAKSSWDEPSLADRERPLNKRGKREAPRIGRLLRQEQLSPDLILSSPARRARKTAQAVAEESGYGGEIHLEEGLYPGDPEAYVETLRALPDHVGRAMLVGHNPGLEEFLEALTGEARPLATATLAQLELPIQRWSELSEETEGALVNLWRARELE